MKIISKYKDYYDYLSGIYGADPKLILDRRNNDNFTLTNNSKIELYIGGYIVEGLYRNNKYYFGNTLKPFIKDEYLSKHELRDYDKSVHINPEVQTQYSTTNFWCYTEPIKDILKINQKENCPILIKNNWGKLLKYPKLDNLNLASFIEPKTIYLWISTWLSTQITLKEQIKTVLSDTEKLESKGFDNKRSFRPKIK